jgi:hypothetical protein
MSNDDTELEETPNADNLKALRDRAASATVAEAEVAKLRKEQLFLRAGIDTESEDPKVKKLATMLFNTYEGDDLEALKNEARDIGLLDAPAQQRGATETDIQSQQFRKDLGQGRSPDPREVPTEDPHQHALKTYHDLRSKGQPDDQARLAAFGEVFGAAFVNGDKRAIFDQEAWNRERAEAGHGQ